MSRKALTQEEIEVLLDQTVDLQGYFDDTMKVITSGDLNTKHKNEVWKNQASLPSKFGCSTGKEFADLLLPKEEEIMKLRSEAGFVQAMKRDKDGKPLLDKDGKPQWNISYVDGGTWRKNKSTICNALDNGIPLLKEDGTPYGSSLIEDMNAAIKRGATLSELQGMSRAEIKATHRTTLTADQYVLENIDKFIRKLNECTKETQEEVQDKLNINVTWK